MILNFTMEKILILTDHTVSLSLFNITEMFVATRRAPKNDT